MKNYEEEDPWCRSKSNHVFNNVDVVVAYNEAYYSNEVRITES